MTTKRKPPVRDVELTVKCIACKATKVLKASDGPHDRIPLCDKDGMPMVATKAKAKM